MSIDTESAGWGILAIFILVMANGFFVAAEFSLVAVRRSRVEELAAEGGKSAKILQRAVGRLDASLAATQLGVTISSLSLGWIGEPALAHLLEPLFSSFGEWSQVGAHATGITVAFIIITALHIVLGELVPKSLALQRSEKTALFIVRPLELFRIFLWPAIFLLNGFGNLLLKAAGLQPGTAEESHHSPEELRLLTAAAGEAGLLHGVQQVAAERLFNFGKHHISDFMTLRPDVVWINAESSREEMLAKIRGCPHEQIIVSRGTVHHVVGVLRRQDILDQALDGVPPDPLTLVREVLIVHDDTPVLEVFEQFKTHPIRMAAIVDANNELKGIVTQTDLLEAIIGYIPAAEGEEPEAVQQNGNSWMMDGGMLVAAAFDQLQIRERPPHGNFHTLAGFALFQLQRIPVAGESFIWHGWKFAIAAMKGRRIEKLLVSKE
ncbi:MAG: HlyC/CorC family transporter [Alphaproteobacteria bacterium]|nr:MAG: HlyC/CorC family transporter [Alphaproteobacteria bacterium]